MNLCHIKSHCAGAQRQMGGSSSKVGRTLPTKARSSGNESQAPRAARPASRPQPLATEEKNEGNFEFPACTSRELTLWKGSCRKRRQRPTSTRQSEPDWTSRHTSSCCVGSNSKHVVIFSLRSVAKSQVDIGRQNKFLRYIRHDILLSSRQHLRDQCVIA